MCEGLCKGRPKTKKTAEEQEKFQAELNKMLGIKKVDDLINENNLENNFQNYMS